MLLALLVFVRFSVAQNTVKKELFGGNTSTIVINGNQIFTIEVSTSVSDYFSITSILDGEFQNQFQIVAKQTSDTLNIDLRQLPFTIKTDDKRSAHKVIAAALRINIPENRNLKIFSDVGSVNLTGRFNMLSVELLQGSCSVDGLAKKSIINTIDGDIDIVTKNAKVNAKSGNGKVKIDAFNNNNFLWQLESINGNITVVSEE